MIKFEIGNPFPSIELSQHGPAEIRAHSIKVDQWLGLRVDDIETELLLSGTRQQPANANGEFQTLWFGLDAQVLLTPYVEIREILRRLNPQAGETVVDLGAAYGRVGFVLARHYPGVSFAGYEYVGERVDEANRCLSKFAINKKDQCEVAVHHSDLSAPDLYIHPAEHFFLYDFGTHKVIEQILFSLRRLALQKKISIVARGRHSQIGRAHV